LKYAFSNLPAESPMDEGVAYWPESDEELAERRPRNMTGVLGTAIVLGSVLARWSDAVVVPPGKGHGKLHEQAYPKPLRPAGKGKDLLRHCRSGWDVSHHGETLYRRRERGRPA
jgi:hypothetical protein